MMEPVPLQSKKIIRIIRTGSIHSVKKMMEPVICRIILIITRLESVNVIINVSFYTVNAFSFNDIEF